MELPDPQIQSLVSSPTNPESESHSEFSIPREGQGAGSGLRVRSDSLHFTDGETKAQRERGLLKQVCSLLFLKKTGS